MDEWYGARVARWRVPLGLVLGVMYLVFAQPTVLDLEVGSALALLGLGLRAIAAGYLDKNERLATEGPYAYTRNPLYLGSLLIGMGVALAGRTWLLGVIFLVFFLVVYVPVMLREAEDLRRRFGGEYERYAELVPLFFPTVSRKKPVEGRFRWSRYVKNREYEAVFGYVASVAFLAIKLKLR